MSESYVSKSNLSTIWSQLDSLFARKEWVEAQGFSKTTVTVGSGDPTDEVSAGMYVDYETGNLWRYVE